MDKDGSGQIDNSSDGTYSFCGDETSIILRNCFYSW